MRTTTCCVLVALAALAAVATLPGSAQAASKACVFLHGAGNLDAGPPTSSFTDYWGDIAAATPQCASWTFNHADTVTQRFDNATLMASYCDVATGGGGSGDGVIRNTIVFTHSMGNNILAAALRAGLCSLDPATATWYLSAPPGRGSKAANMVETICSSQSWLDGPIRDIATLFHYCQNDAPGPANLAYVSLQTTDPSLVGLADVMAQHASGALCGTSAFGLVSKYSLGLEALSALVDYGEPNDGMVAQSSCAVNPNVTFTGNAQDPYYLAAVNHADATGRDGNGDFGADRQPLAWFGART